MTLPELRPGDMRDVLRDLAAAGETFHACVCDPPYHLTSIVKRFGQAGSAPLREDPKGGAFQYNRLSRGFMGKEWDGGDIAMRAETWRLVWDVLPPGGHLVAFGGTRTFHRMAVAIEDAGFELRDTLMWLYGSGFPKSHNQEGEWEGWGTALKPGWEPIILARKPLAGTVAANCLEHGTGALNIDGCRVPYASAADAASATPAGKSTAKPGALAGGMQNDAARVEFTRGRPEARWPANVLHDGSPDVEEAFAAFGERGASAPVRGTESSAASVGLVTGKRERVPGVFHGDTGSASRFFYGSKASGQDRVRQCSGCKVRFYGKRPCACDAALRSHPTVKPIDLMRWLVRLVTPPGGRVLDCFAGSGSTLVAAHHEGMRALGVEMDPDYQGDIAWRIGQLGAAMPAP